MGVPALFRWLSRKYPKIVRPVKEDVPRKELDGDGKIVEVPIRFEGPNPNGFEVDNLYLDMNGIVHPCTHPENGVAPETEEDMMVAIFRYTERVVNMARPRKVLMMAIDGVAPRAKMNQQRSRRFRAAQEAHDKEIERLENIKAFEALGKPVSDEYKNQKPWDSNAITPGTPFMDLLANSLKYWVSYKLTSDPGWKDLKVIISDSSVPGEGEHKIVDWIRRQRSHPEWDPNTSHVIYGLDADLIMLALATHEPNFRVLREDVFLQSAGPKACKNCGKEGHFAANCKGSKKVEDPEAKVVEKAKPVDPKPFIWLDVSILREYLAVELRVPNTPFPFDGEIAIDDWIFMIFFVGNDFLPHLPSLEIREGAIDMLLKIWKAELARMGGYLTYHGKVNLERAGIILEGLAKNEDEIFQRRKESEDRQEANQKRRRMEDHRRQDMEQAAAQQVPPGLNGQDYTQVTPSDTARGGALHPSLPARPSTVMVSPPAKKLTPAEREEQSRKLGLALGGTNQDLINNRKAIRMANLDAAALLKAELEGDAGEVKEEETVVMQRTEDEEQVEMTKTDAQATLVEYGEENGNDEEMEPSAIKADSEDGEEAVDRPGDEPEDPGRKRKRDDDDEEDSGSDVEAPPNPEADQPVTKKKLKINPDGTVDGYVDDVRMWEPGYMERYYRNKFGVELSDREFIDKITYHYMEGLCWVLEYYYNGVPAWDWYYPYHYAPFAQDFRHVSRMKIEFKPAMPFKPFGQLLGVFPAASRKHLPVPLQTLMTDEDSPIIDFYPEDFDIDMNGKKMAWQGVALLPFIDPVRLVAALGSKEDQFTDDEKRRNRWGDNVMFIADGSQLYEPFCGLYTLKATSQPISIDPILSQGTNGKVLADPSCVPNSAFESPLENIEACPDIDNNSSISVRYFFPRQEHSHRSEVLRGYKPGHPALDESDKDWVRKGGGSDNGGRRNGGGPRHSGGGGAPMGSGPGLPRNGGGRGPPPPRYGNGGMRDSYQPPPPPRGAHQQTSYPSYGAPPPVRANGYGGPPQSNYSPYGQMPPAVGGYNAPPPPSYGGQYGGNGGSYGNNNGFNRNAPAPSSAYGGYPPPSGASRNPYGPPPTSSYQPPPPQNGYGGNRGGAYNPYGGNQRY